MDIGTRYDPSDKQIVVIYDPPRSNAPLPHAPRFRFHEAQIEKEYAVTKIATYDRVQSWTTGDTFNYVLFDCLVAPRILLGTGAGLILGPAKPRCFYLIPFVDFFGRIAGDGLRRQDYSDSGSAGNEFEVPQKMKNNYALNLFDWFGWLIPGYPVFSSRTITESVEREAREEKKLTDGPPRTVLLSTYLPASEALNRYEFLVDSRPVRDLVPGASLQPVPAAEGFVVLDLAAYIECEKWMAEQGAEVEEGNRIKIAVRDHASGREMPLWSSAALNVAGLALNDSDIQAKYELAVTRPVDELNVDWFSPRRLGEEPPHLNIELALQDGNGDGRWQRTETLQAKLTLRNVENKREAWNLIPVWILPPEVASEVEWNEEDCIRLPPETPGEVRLRAKSPIKRLNPGEMVEQTLTLTPRANWVVPDDRFSLRVEVEAFNSKGAYSPDSGAIETSSNLPPQLALQAIDWRDSDGDGVLSPREDVDVLISVANQGLGASRDAMVKLIPDETAGSGYRAVTAYDPLPLLSPYDSSAFRWSIRLAPDWERAIDVEDIRLPFRVLLEDRNPEYVRESELILPRRELLNKPLGVVYAQFHSE